MVANTNAKTNLVVTRRSHWLGRVVAASLLWNAYLTLRLLSDHSLPAVWDHADAMMLQHRGSRRSLLPDWRYAVDCSVYDNMCGVTTMAERTYGPYPFPLGRHIKDLDRFDYRTLASVPDEWRSAMRHVHSLDRPPPRSVSYVYPPRVRSSAETATCVREAMKVPWQDQLDALLDSGRIRKEATTDMVAFTLGDVRYAKDMLHDVFEMASSVVGFDGSFFLVALDEATATMACAFGYPCVAWHGDPRSPAGAAPLKHDVARAKFRVSHHLVARGAAFFFYEMDVWFLTSPRALIAGYHREDRHDLLLSSHVGDPLSVNIGVYSASANARTVEFFQLCLQMAQVSRFQI